MVKVRYFGFNLRRSLGFMPRGYSIKIGQQYHTLLYKGKSCGLSADSKARLKYISWRHYYNNYYK